MSRIVELHDHAPLVLKRSEMERDVVAICRCGLSAKWPMCDGSHGRTLDEPAGALCAYTREAGTLARKPISGLGPGRADPRA